MVFLSGYSFGSHPCVARYASPDKEKEHLHLSITVQRYYIFVISANKLRKTCCKTYGMHIFAFQI
jgi:hypothetical protein